MPKMCIQLDLAYQTICILPWFGENATIEWSRVLREEMTDSDSLMSDRDSPFRTCPQDCLQDYCNFASVSREQIPVDSCCDYVKN